MVVKICESHASRDAPVLVRAKEIIDKQCNCSVEEAVSVIEELAAYEKEIRTLRQSIFEAMYADILVGLIKPLKEHFE